MADVTISSLPLGTPSGNGVIPFSLGGNTYQAPVSGLFQNRPAFSAFNTVNQPTKPSGYKMQFRTQVLNIGGFYDFENDDFIVPYNGVYQLNFNAILNNRNGGNYTAVGFWNSRTNTWMATSCYESSALVRTFQLSQIYPLLAGDRVSVKWYTDGTSLDIDNSGLYTGYLIG